MQIPATPIPSYARQGTRWTRFGWSCTFDPGDSFEAIPIGKTPATVTAHVTDTPPDARVRFQHSPDGKRGWSDLEGGDTAFHKVRPGDTREWNGLRGFIRPVVDGDKFGRIKVQITIIPDTRQYRVTGEPRYTGAPAG